MDYTKQAHFKSLMVDFHALQKSMKTNMCLENMWQYIQKSTILKNVFENGQQNVKCSWFKS